MNLFLSIIQIYLLAGIITAIIYLINHILGRKLFPMTDDSSIPELLLDLLLIVIGWPVSLGYITELFVNIFRLIILQFINIDRMDEYMKDYDVYLWEYYQFDTEGNERLLYHERIESNLTVSEYYNEDNTKNVRIENKKDNKTKRVQIPSYVNIDMNTIELIDYIEKNGLATFKTLEQKEPLKLSINGIDFNIRFPKTVKILDLGTSVQVYDINPSQNETDDFTEVSNNVYAEYRVNRDKELISIEKKDHKMVVIGDNKDIEEKDDLVNVEYYKDKDIHTKYKDFGSYLIKGFNSVGDEYENHYDENHVLKSQESADEDEISFLRVESDDEDNNYIDVTYKVPYVRLYPGYLFSKGKYRVYRTDNYSYNKENKLISVKISYRILSPEDEKELQKSFEETIKSYTEDE